MSAVSVVLVCGKCATAFEDGIDAGHHEIENPGHVVSWEDGEGFARFVAFEAMGESMSGPPVDDGPDDNWGAW